MKKVLMLSLLCIVIGFSAVAQDLDTLLQMDPQSPEFAAAVEQMMGEVNLDNVEFYFAGPVDLLVRNVVFDGVRYAALLSYDGEGNFEIRVPSSSSAAGLPMALDLSEATVSADLEKIRISDVIADGYYFSGDLVLQDSITEMMLAQAYIGQPVGEVDVDAYVAQIDELEEENADLRAQLRSAQRTADSSDDERVAALQDEIASLNRQIDRLESGDMAASPADRADDVTRTVPEAQGTPARGNWSMSSAGMRQADAGELFAKYVVPARQSASELVYELSGRANGDGWRGFGLHFLASNSQAASRYGFGQSYLLWVNRDPVNLGTDETYVQLYKSFDDVRMIQVASKAIAGDIGNGVDVTAYVDRDAKTIYVVVDDEVLFEYQDDSFYSSGSNIAVRALGDVTITNVEVRTR